MEKELTILITTYNRETRLKEMLHSIEKQCLYDYYKLIIVDNCSPTYEWSNILNDFNIDFRSIITVQRRNYNCGMSCNIASCFLYVDTKWVLYLSDDDELESGSLEKILSDMNKFKNTSAVKYTIKGCKSHSNVSIKSINDFISYYKHYPDAGDSIFLTMLYNMNKLKDFLYLGTSYSYTFIGFMLPVLGALAKNEGDLFMSSQVILKYKLPEPNKGWNPITVSKGFSIFLDIPLGISFEDQCSLFYYLVRPFFNRGIYTYLFAKEINSKERRYIYDTLYFKIVKPTKVLNPIEFKFIFYFNYLFNINLYKNIHCLKLKLRKPFIKLK